MRKVLIILILASCSNEIVVRVDFDKSVEIHRWTRYDWLKKKDLESRNSPLVYNELNDKRIKSAANATLAGLGYVIDGDKPQFLVHYHIIIEDKIAEIETEPHGYTYSSHWKSTQTDVRRYQEGTLILDFMDSQDCELIWRGWAVSVLDDERVLSEALINEAVVKILGRFPMSAEKEAKTY